MQNTMVRGWGDDKQGKYVGLGEKNEEKGGKGKK